MPPAARTARSGWSSWGKGAPKTAITASPTNCMTVPSSPRTAPFMAARCSLSWAASCAGGVCSAMVEYPDVGHEDGHLDVLGLAHLPALGTELLGQAAREQPVERLALLLPVDDGLMEHPEPA